VIAGCLVLNPRDAHNYLLAQVDEIQGYKPGTWLRVSERSVVIFSCVVQYTATISMHPEALARPPSTIHFVNVPVIKC